MDGVWEAGVPDTHGFYLVAWRKSPFQIVVSEVWFNPDANPNWWFTRRYIPRSKPGMYHDALRKEVVGWMPMPDPPKG